MRQLFFTSYLVRILIVKLSSMGDIIHALPVVADLRRTYPQAQIDWVVEEAFVEIVRAHADIARVIPIALRRWKKNLLARQTRTEWRAFRHTLRAEAYDWVFDLQGLGKSAWIATRARRTSQGKTIGFPRTVAKEGWSTWLLNGSANINPQQHMIEQLRAIPGLTLGYPTTTPPEFGLALSHVQPTWAPPTDRYAVLLHMTAATYKLWGEVAWGEVAHWLASQQITPVLPWGSMDEKARAERIVAAAGSGVVAPRLGLLEWGKLMQSAQLVIGLDTGLSHLAAALGARTIFLFGATPQWRIAPYWGKQHITLGEPGHWPTSAEVCTTLAQQLKGAIA